jgi:hypothetical protein
MYCEHTRTNLFAKDEAAELVSKRVANRLFEGITGEVLKKQQHCKKCHGYLILVQIQEPSVNAQWFTARAFNQNMEVIE